MRAPLLDPLLAPDQTVLALEPGDVRGIVVGFLLLVGGVAAVVVAVRRVREQRTSEPAHQSWPTVEAEVVTVTRRPQPFTGDIAPVEGAAYRVVRYPGRDGEPVRAAVPPRVRVPPKAGTPVTLHVDPTGASTPVAAHRQLPATLALLALGVLCVGGGLLVWLA